MSNAATISFYEMPSPYAHIEEKESRAGSGRGAYEEASELSSGRKIASMKQKKLILVSREA